MHKCLNQKTGLYQLAWIIIPEWTCSATVHYSTPNALLLMLDLDTTIAIYILLISAEQLHWSNPNTCLAEANHSK